MSTETISEDMVADPRYIRQNASHAVADVYDALVELITNSDDSYDKVPSAKKHIRIEIRRSRGAKSILVVKDRAQGMTLDEMKTKLGKIGKRTSSKTDRGVMARGAKDCASLGNVKFESIKEDEYSWFQIDSHFRIQYPKRSSSVTDAIRKNLGIPRGNGTVVTIEIEARHDIPQHDTLLQRLPKHFALRDILSDKSNTKVELVDLSNVKPRVDLLMASAPAGVLVFKNSVEIPHYNGIFFDIELYKAQEPFLGEQTSSRFRRGGVLVKDLKAIHEITYFDRKLENETSAQRYFGVLKCPHIRELCEEYDRLEQLGEQLLKTNPFFILDPNRKGGLEKKHPFTVALYSAASKILNEFIEKDKKELAKRERSIENDVTKKQLAQLAKAASQFLKEKIANIDEFSKDGTKSSSETLVKQGVAIFPEYAKMEVGEIRTFNFRAIIKSAVNYEDPVFVTAESDCLQILTPEVKLKKFKSEKFMYAQIQAKAIKESGFEGVGIGAKFDGFPEAVGFVKVIKPGSDTPDLMPDGLSFEHAKYSVPTGGKRILKVFADVNKGFSAGDKVNATSSNSNVVLLGRPPVFKKHERWPQILEACLEVTGRQHGAAAKIEARVKSISTATRVSINDKEDEGIPMEIKMSDKEMGAFRAWWDIPDNPHLLLVSATHPTVSRYLGPPDAYIGQDAPHFKLLLAEIVTERICQRVMDARAQEDPRAFSSDDGFDVQAFYVEHNKIVTEFAPTAHKILFSEEEFKKATENIQNAQS